MCSANAAVPMQQGLTILPHVTCSLKHHFRATVEADGALGLTPSMSCVQARAFYGFQIAIENIHSGEHPGCREAGPFSVPPTGQRRDNL